MNILFLSQLLPYPLDAGAKVREYYVLRYLAQHHRVTLAAFIRETDTEEAQAHLALLVDRLITCPLRRSLWREAGALGRSLIFGEPVLVARDHDPNMSVRLRQLMAESPFDAIHADQLWMASYALELAKVVGDKPGKPMKVLDQHNAMYLIPQRLAESASQPAARLAWRREGRQMARYEAAICRSFDHVVTVTETDRAALTRLYPGNSAPTFSVIPICIETELGAPRPLSVAPGMLFLGGMHWPPNADGARWFAEAILPIIRQGAPQARFLAVGRQPPSRLQRAPEDIEAPGYVIDPEPYWAQSQVFVVPLRAGGGMRVKILEAWVRGLPVVSTTIGAEGLVYQAGENILIGDTPAAFAAAVVSVLNDSNMAHRLAAGGQATVKQHYNWRLTYAAWDSIYEPR